MRERNGGKGASQGENEHCVFHIVAHPSSWDFTNSLSERRKPLEKVQQEINKDQSNVRTHTVNKSTNHTLLAENAQVHRSPGVLMRLLSVFSGAEFSRNRQKGVFVCLSV